LFVFFQLFRHGDRSPIDIYPKDKFKTDQWPMGLGELTKLGRREAYHLGEFFQQRYKERLKVEKDFKPNSPEFFIRSTEKSRSKLSAVYFMAGFYGEDFSNVMKKEKEVQTKYNVPFVPQKQDQLLSKATCPKADKLLQDWKSTSREYKKFMKHNADLFKLMVYTGWSDHEQMNLVIDDIYIERRHNFSKPDWVENNIGPLTEYFDDSKKFLSPTPQLLKINTGPLMSKLIKEIEDKIHKESQKKMIAFSAHDSTIINFLLGLQSFNNRQPPYSSAVIIELYQNQKMFYVNILYHNDSKTEPYHFTIPGCKHNETCAWEVLKEHAQKIAISTQERELFCGSAVKSGSLILSDNIIPVAVVIVIVVCAVLSIIMYRLYRRCRRPVGDPMMYRPLALGDVDD
ncbi:hypothetical protein LOTGIDRAFT_170346, partial [Lottia gigantea]